MSIYHKGKYIKRKFIKGQELNKCWRQGHIVFSRPLYKFLDNVKDLGITINEDEYIRAYYSLDSKLINDADVILLPYVVQEGKVYGMNNKTGAIVEFNFSRASKATLFDVNINMNLVSINQPRIDFGNYNNNAKILLEKESTNLITNSGSGNYDTLQSIYASDRNLFTKSNNSKFGEFLQILGKNGYRSASITCLPLTNYSYSVYLDSPSNYIDLAGVRLAAYDGSGGYYAKIDFDRINGFNRYIHKFKTRASTTYDIQHIYTNSEFMNTTPLKVACFQFENDDATSFIPSNGSQTTRAAELLSINLPKATEVYLKTTKNEITLNKASGIWNIQEDVINDGIEVLAIMNY